jgi:FAD/FMN-containing dehydrogenase
MMKLRRGSASSEPTALARFNRDVKPAIASAAQLILERFPRTRKNSSGYALDAYLASGDVLDLIIGAEGTLGIVCEIEWRLDHIPPFRAGLRVHLASLDRLSDAVSALNQCEPSALELLDRTFLDLIGAGAWGGVADGFVPEAILLVELERGDPEALRQVLAAASQAIQGWATSIEMAYSPPEAERLWAIRHAASPILAGLPEERRSLQVIEDACVPIEQMSEYIRTVRRAAAQRDVPVVMFGHAGDGHIHVNLLPNVTQRGWEQTIASLMDDVTDAVIRLGGTLSGEHGDGRLRAAALVRVYGAEIVELFRRVKQSFDPLGIFNPGVILPCPEGPHAADPPISRLKVGSTAIPLPEDVQSSLREIERTAGYGRYRLASAGEVKDEGQIADV